jgi:UPF0755 protein
MADSASSHSLDHNAETPASAGRAHRRPSRLVLYFLVLSLVAVALAGGAWIVFQRWADLDSRKPGIADVRVEIGKGRSLRGIARQLEVDGLLDNEWLFVVLAHLAGREGKIQAGKYDIAPGTPPRELLAILSEGRVVPAAAVTLPEGWTTERMLERLVARGIISDPERFRALSRDAEFLRQLRVSAPSVEGWLFPDTYHFDTPTDEAEALKRMVGRFHQELKRLNIVPGATHPGAHPLDLAQTVVLASIIERETRLASEMPLVSSVFHNRLKAGMRLDSCATVRFATGNLIHALTREDLRVVSPYNTYIHKGLPPGPICNPGGVALKAAFQPESTDFLYYVFKGLGDGGHVFSRTLQEHNRARNQYKDNWQYAARPRTTEESDH